MQRTSKKVEIGHQLSSVVAGRGKSAATPHTGMETSTQLVPSLEMIRSAYIKGCPTQIENLIAEFYRQQTRTDARSDNPISKAINALLSAIHKLVAMHPETPGWLLDELAGSLCEEVLKSVADHPSTGAATILSLANHSSSEVRSSVADNKNASEDALWILAHDQHPDVRYRLAENHSTPLSILDFLCDDENPYIANRSQKTKWRLCQ